MAKAKKINESYNVSYTARDQDSNDDIKAISINWENRSNEEVMENLNIWLTAIGCGLEVIEKKS